MTEQQRRVKRTEKNQGFLSIKALMTEGLRMPTKLRKMHMIQNENTNYWRSGWVCLGLGTLSKVIQSKVFCKLL